MIWQLLSTVSVIYGLSRLYNFYSYYSYPDYFNNVPYISLWEMIQFYIRKDGYDTLYEKLLKPHFLAGKHVVTFSPYGWTLQVGDVASAKFASTNYDNFHRNTFHTMGARDGLGANYFGEPVGFVEGADWERQRPIFSTTLLRIRPTAAVEEAGFHLLSAIDKNGTKPFDMSHAAKRTLFRSLMTAVFNVPELLENDGDLKLSTDMYSILYASFNPLYLILGFLDRPWFPLRKSIFNRADAVDKLVKKVLEQKKQELKAIGIHSLDEVEDKKELDLTTLMLLANMDPEQPKITEREILDNVKSLFLVGYETTATAFSCMMYLLALHPEAQYKARAEVQRVMKVFPGDAVRAPSVQEQKELEYLNAVLKESQRMYPPTAQTLEKFTSVDTTLPDGTFLPQGAKFTINIWALCHDPNVWKNPDLFNPERHLGTEREGRGYGEFMVFGAGKRNCPGMNLAVFEERVVVAMLLQKYKWRLSEPTKPLNLASPFYLLNPKDVNLIFEPVA